MPGERRKWRGGLLRDARCLVWGRVHARCLLCRVASRASPLSYGAPAFVALTFAPVCILRLPSPPPVIRPPQTGSATCPLTSLPSLLTPIPSRTLHRPGSVACTPTSSGARAGCPRSTKSQRGRTSRIAPASWPLGSSRAGEGAPRGGRGGGPRGAAGQVWGHFRKKSVGVWVGLSLACTLPDVSFIELRGGLFVRVCAGRAT